MMNTAVADLEQGLSVELCNHPIENSNWDSSNFENIDFLAVGGKELAEEVEGQSGWVAEVSSDQNSLEVAVEGMVCTMPCPLDSAFKISQKP